MIMNSRTAKNNASVLPHLKPDITQLNTADCMSNKENLPDYNDRKKHVITARYGLAPQNTNRVREHVLPNSLIMSGSQTQVKKVKILSGALLAQSVDGKKATATKPRDKKAGVTSGHKHDSHVHVSPSGVSRVHNSLSPRISSKDESSNYFVTGRSIGKPAGSKTEKTELKSNSLPQVNPALLQVKDRERREERIRRASPGSSPGQIARESSAEYTRKSMNHSATKPKGRGTERNARTPNKVTPNASSATRARRNDESPEQSLEERVLELELPKVTMNEVLQSWNIGPPSRTRSSSLAGKDPMEFLLSRERSNSDPKQRMTTIEELRRCRYLRTGGKDDHESHAKFCSCNSCEHGEGLKSTPYLNS